MQAERPFTSLWPQTSAEPRASAGALSRRVVLGRAMIGVQVLLLAACGGDDEDDAQQPRAAPEAPQASAPKLAREPTMLTLGAVSDEHATAIGNAIELWNKDEIPGAPEGTQLQRVKIGVAPSRDPLAFIEHLQEKATAFLSEQESAGTPVDLLMVNRLFDFPWAFCSGIIQPIDRFLQQDQDEPIEEFLPSAVELVRFHGETMALPVAVNVGVARYNPRTFDDAGIAAPDKGWTREDFVSAAQRLTEDSNGDGTVDAWGFLPERTFVNWLPFVMQELGQDVIDLDTGAVRLTDPAALRGLDFWDGLGRVHSVMPYGATVTEEQFNVDFNGRLPALFFWFFLSSGSMLPGRQAPLPTGPGDVTPLMLGNALAIPANARDAAQSYEVMAPLALYLGERILMPAAVAGLQHIEEPTSGYSNLLLPEHDQQLALHLLDTSRAAPLATSLVMTFQLFRRLALPLARGEVDVVRAAQQAQEWLESYLNQ